MLKHLKEKWGVSTRQFWILFIIFGLTGTTTALLTRYITLWLGMDASVWWVWKILLRIGILLFGYQFILLAYAAIFGQWSFFWKYEKKLFRKLGILRGERRNISGKLFIDERINQKLEIKNQKLMEGKNQLQTPNSQLPTKKIAIFASGAGSNAEKIIEHLTNHSSIQVGLIVCNKPGAGVLSIAEKHNIPSLLINKETFFSGDAYVAVMKKYGIDFIVLAGFLWKIPLALITAYPGKIINIHPALLPKYGGKGMYGMRVHAAVMAAGEKESGITIHYVNEHFDEGEPIFQARCEVDKHDTAETLAQKIHALEHTHFPLVIERLILSST